MKRQNRITTAKPRQRAVSTYLNMNIHATKITNIARF